MAFAVQGEVAVAGFCQFTGRREERRKVFVAEDVAVNDQIAVAGKHHLGDRLLESLNIDGRCRSIVERHRVAVEERDREVAGG